MSEFEFSLDWAQGEDKNDELRSFRELFIFPRHQGKSALYFTGNSLGLQPKSARAAIDQELNDWAEHAVEGHFRGKNAWMYYHHFLTENTAKIVGAKPEEVVVMNNLTTNLHLMMVSFYRPTKERYKIIMEGGAFPSDQYAMESQVRFHGFEPGDAIIELQPRDGEYTLRTEDILGVIKKNASELALVMLGGVNYYTGQYFKLEEICKAAHEAGAVCGYDLAHAAGNLPVKLHEWNVDFAVWCSYKYLNSGPGGTSGVFVHERHGNDPSLPRFAGWWGHDEKERFKMKKGFKPMKGAQGWQLSNAQVLPMAVHKASLEIFAQAGIERLRRKSLKLTAYLEFILKKLSAEGLNFQLLTPESPDERGCQLSLLLKNNGHKLFKYLSDHGVFADWREPDVMRLAPVPLYNSFEDVYRLGECMRSFIALRQTS